MKLKEALKRHEEYGDFDVISDYGCYVAYCGTGLTEAGEKHYADVLELECEFVYNSLVGNLQLSVALPNEEFDDKLERMLYDMAGYCSERHYETCFTEY